jgi:hypothetical protein
MGLDGMRLIAAVAAEADPWLATQVAAKRPAEWKILVRDRQPDAPPLSAVASTCSERRLHAESEQVMRVIDVVAALLTRLAARQPVDLVIHGAARIDLPSLRGLLRIADRARAARVTVNVVLPGARDRADRADEDGAATRVRALAWQAFWRRCSACAVPPPISAPPLDGAEPLAGGEPPEARASGIPASLERDYFDLARQGGSAEKRLAGSLLAMRASFFSTSYDVGLAAAGYALQELARPEKPDLADVRAFLADASSTDDPASIGIGPDDIIDTGAVVSLVHRYRGMIHAFVLDYPAALREFDTAVRATRIPYVRARARLLRALASIKRTGDVEAGLRDATDGLAELAAGGGPGDAPTTSAVEAAWLYNVRALGHVQRRDLPAALADERAAARLVGKLFTTDATHLKVNLVSNLSVLAEYSADPHHALALWRRFARHEAGWSDAFTKHHAYREGGLLIKAGRITEGEPLLTQAHDRAVASGDQFHALAIALELGGLMLDHGGPDSAAQWYDTAAEHAAEFGDAYHEALALAGKQVSAGELPASEAERLAGRAADSVGYPGPAAELSRALSGGDTAGVDRLLPRPRTKLNRAFAPVRLEFESR